MPMLSEVHAVIWVILLPLIFSAISFLFQKYSARIGLIAANLTVFAVVLLLKHVLDQGPIHYRVGGWGAPLGIDLYVDGLSALMLLMTAVIGIAVSVYSLSYFRSDAAQRIYFWPLWLILWAALNALFLSADLFNVYVTLELLGLAAVSLAALTGKGPALGAAMRYLLVSLLGSMAYLLGVAMLYAAYGILDMGQLGKVINAGPVSWIALALMTAGLLLKSALFPMHFWLPQAHANAPAPVSAVLSALVVKASFYLLLRIWFEIFDAVITPGAAQFVGVLGALAVLWGSLLALRQKRLKLLVAYSTVAQLGYLFLAFPLVASIGSTAWLGVVYFALSHAVAKAAMFMSVGAMMRAAGHDRINNLNDVASRMPLSMVAFTLAGVSLIGLPPSGGFVAKWTLLQAALNSGQWWWVLIILTGGMLAAVYVFRFVACAFSSRTDVQVVEIAGGLQWSAVALAILAIALGFTAVYVFDLLMLGGVGVVSIPAGAVF